MKKSTVLGLTAVTGVALATSIVSPAYAWNPEGKITKYVTNVTAGTAKSDANSASAAIAAKPGDTLVYTIVISNPAKDADNNHNDLAYVVLKDTLPTGVELVGDASKRSINENLGTILPGKSVTKEYSVTVTATKDGVIENKACFTGDSEVKDSPKSGCDTANVKVTVPPAPVTPPATPVTPVTPPAGKGAEPAPVAAPAELPKTGPASAIAIFGLTAVAGYAANMLRLRLNRQSA